MAALFFYIFALVTLLFGAGVVIFRNPVASALSLVVSFSGLAALFITLDAYFIGVIQILVYAGAVMVLFLFIIMLLDIKAEEHRKLNVPSVLGGGALALVFMLQLIVVLGKHEYGNQTLDDVRLQYSKAAATQKLETIKSDLKQETLPDTKLVGQTLFQSYGLQIQLVGFLLLSGAVGVVILSKREVNYKKSMITLNHYLFVSGALFAIGLAGVVVRRSILVIYMCLELMLSAANLTLIAFSRFRLVDGLPDYNAQALVFFTITVAAAEVAVGLAIIVALFRAKQSVDVGAVDKLKG